ncbi:F0F1 ATP synthase subunit B [Halomonas sp. HP20-15]|uniref:F0F1 ATP synthase subunit B n=1 Tax=Halomonas sp. HP20-15 TaxID=3085901 RepID=UPI002982006A|nr:F0F1 ATP synthase subunit B [Halomonas sp. HP20-15]MDW5375903.1 F0F1 ATP synthase subunit B [Halomonas sp. HP20-15]
MNIGITLLVEILSFGLFIYFFKRVLWGPLMKVMNDRQARIGDGLEAAQQAQQELEAANAEAQRILRESREESASILDQARARTNTMIEEAREEARAEGDRMIERARGEIEQELNRAREELRAQVASLAVVGAERILESSIDEQKHNEMLDKLAAEL